MANPKPLMAKSSGTDPANTAIESALRTLDAEAGGVAAIAAALQSDLRAPFAAAAERIRNAKGRLIVTGLGKSGHIGRKIAATFASTGTPAQFVHPAEASHGDLGMIAPGDAVLALSNSGETAELADIVAYTRRFRIPLVALTRRDGSALSEAADITLVLPATEEGCPMGLAPMSSTTMMLALGDALAAAMLERKGFSSADFHSLHPGGQLGRQLLTVRDIMHVGEAMPLVPLGTSMANAILTMSEKTFGCVGVTDGSKRLIGIITDGDLRRHMADDLLRSTVDQVMTKQPKTIRPQALAVEALGRMNQQAITSLFAVDDESRPLGIVRIHDCLRAGIA